MTEIFDDIRGMYTFHAPCPELADFIEFFSESAAEGTMRLAGERAFTVRLFPSWTPTIWINLGGPYHIEQAGTYECILPGRDVLVLRDSVLTRHNQPGDHIFTVKFFPGGLEAVLGLGQAGMRGQVIDLGSVLPASLIGAVKAAGDFPERKALLEGYLLGRMGRRRGGDHYRLLVKASMGLCETGGLHYNTSEMAEKLFTTSRTINRYFHRVVGTSPKKYFSLIRARSALTAFALERADFSPEGFGYHDMSHFYRDMVKFTGRRIRG